MKRKAGIFHFFECDLETRVIVLSDFTPQEAGRESLWRRENGQRAGEEEGGAHEHPPRVAFVLWPTRPCRAERGCVRHTGLGQARWVEKGLLCSAFHGQTYENQSYVLVV